MNEVRPENPEPAPGANSSAGAPTAGRLGRVILGCGSCGTDTVHRILHLSRGSASGKEIAGIARCSECRSTHPFRLATPEVRRAEVRLIISEGSTSSAAHHEFSAADPLQIGSVLEIPGGPVWVRRIQTRSSGDRPAALAGQIAALWVTRQSAFRIPISIVEGARTQGLRSPSKPTDEFEVGALFPLGGRSYRIEAIRGRGRNHTTPGVRVRALEIERIYLRPPEDRRREGRSTRPRGPFVDRGSRSGFRPRAAPVPRGRRRYPRRSARMPPAGNRA